MHGFCTGIRGLGIIFIELILYSSPSNNNINVMLKNVTFYRVIEYVKTVGKA